MDWLGALWTRVDSVARILDIWKEHNARVFNMLRVIYYSHVPFIFSHYKRGFCKSGGGSIVTPLVPPQTVMVTQHNIPSRLSSIALVHITPLAMSSKCTFSSRLVLLCLRRSLLHQLLQLVFVELHRLTASSSGSHRWWWQPLFW